MAGLLSGYAVSAGRKGPGAVLPAGHAQHGASGLRRRRRRLIVNEGEQVLARVEIPGLVAALALERVGYTLCCARDR